MSLLNWKLINNILKLFHFIVSRHEDYRFLENSKSITHSEESRDYFYKLQAALKSGKNKTVQERLKIVLLQSNFKFHKKAADLEDEVRYKIKEFKRSYLYLKMRNRISKSERVSGECRSRTAYRAENQILKNELQEMIEIHSGAQDGIDKLNSYYQSKVKGMEREICELKSDLIALKKETSGMIKLIENANKKVDDLKIEFETKIERFMQDQLAHNKNQEARIDEQTNRIDEQTTRINEQTARIDEQTVRIDKQTTLINHCYEKQSVENQIMRRDVSNVDSKLSNVDFKISNVSSQLSNQASVSERLMEAILAKLEESDHAKSTSSFANSRNKHAKVDRSFNKFSDMKSMCVFKLKIIWI